MRTRILIITDSAVLPTGMAETTRLIFFNLLDKYPDTYELHQVGLFHCYAVTEPRWPIYPTETEIGPDGIERFAPNDRYGQKTFLTKVATVQPHIVFAFGDAQRLIHLCTPPAARQYRLILYVNFDGLPFPPYSASALSHADLILTKTEFSKNVLARTVPNFPPKKLHYMYSPADIERFSPVSEEAREKLREDLLPDWMPRNAFVLGWVGRNQWRKQVWILYKVIHYLRTGAYFLCQKCSQVSLFDWDPSQQKHLQGAVLESPPGYRHDGCVHCQSLEVNQAEPMLDVFLWLHMPEEPNQDWSPKRLEQQFGLKRGRDILYTEAHEVKAALSLDDVPLLYNIWDCLLYLTGGEGFGLPAWEAMCAGLPVIYTNYSSHAEFVSRGSGGIAVGGILQPERDTCVWRMIADVPQAISAVRKIYFDREHGKKLGANGRSFCEQFAPEIQVARWHTIFQNQSLFH